MGGERRVHDTAEEQESRPLQLLGRREGLGGVVLGRPLDLHGEARLLIAGAGVDGVHEVADRAAVTGQVRVTGQVGDAGRRVHRGRGGDPDVRFEVGAVGLGVGLLQLSGPSDGPGGRIEPVDPVGLGADQQRSVVEQWLGVHLAVHGSREELPEPGRPDEDRAQAGLIRVPAVPGVVAPAGRPVRELGRHRRPDLGAFERRRRTARGGGAGGDTGPRSGRGDEEECHRRSGQPARVCESTRSRSLLWASHGPRPFGRYRSACAGAGADGVHDRPDSLAGPPGTPEHRISGPGGGAARIIRRLGSPHRGEVRARQDRQVVSDRPVGSTSATASGRRPLAVGPYGHRRWRMADDPTGGGVTFGPSTATPSTAVRGTGHGGTAAPAGAGRTPAGSSSRLPTV